MDHYQEFISDTLHDLSMIKIEPRKSNEVNHLVRMLGDKLIFHLINFKRQKRWTQIPEKF